MTKRERWLTTVALVLSVLPLIIVAFILKLYPSESSRLIDNIIIIEPPQVKDDYISKYNNLVIGLFCVVPLSIVIIASYIKRKLVEYDNYTAILIVSIVLSVFFSAIALYGVVNQAVTRGGIIGFDAWGFLAVSASLFAALCGNLTRYFKFGSRFAINNRFTRSSVSVWKTVHRNAGILQTLGFTLMAVPLSFISGWAAAVVFVGAAGAFIAWTFLHSYRIRNLFAKRKTETEESSD
jgi:hypothetical protein